MNNQDWVIIDFETTGLIDPIYIIEIAAQKMRGWDPDGDPFNVYINHDVEIPSDAIAIHGITNEFINENGLSPEKAHSKFLDYVKGLPLVAHNLSYDWDRCLIRECNRYSFKIPGTRGFCTLLLGRRLFPEFESLTLDSFRHNFNISYEGSHTASVDVEQLVSLFKDKFRPRLELLSLDSYKDIKEFSTSSPISKCHDRVISLCSVVEGVDLVETANQENKSPKKRKYILDKEIHTSVPSWYSDPITIKQGKVLKLFGETNVSNMTKAKASFLINKYFKDDDNVIKWKKYVYLTKDTFNDPELLPFEDSELHAVRLPDDWSVEDIDSIKVKEIYDKGKLYNDPVPNIIFDGKSFVFSGSFQIGSKSLCKSVIEGLGGIFQKGINAQTDYLVVGSKGSDRFKEGNYGTKMEKAMKKRLETGKPIILHEDDWVVQIDL